MKTKETVEKAFGLSLDKRIQDLRVDEVFAGISKLEEDGYGDAQNRPISMFIGATRCGKSTTTNLFLGNPLIVKKDDDQSVPPPLRKIVLVEQKDSGGKFPVIGTKTTSETTVPMKYMLEDGGILWDCPGFGDSRGPQQEIINAWFVSRLFKTSPGVKLFNLCSAQSITDSANVAEFRGYVQQIIDLFGGEKLTGIKQTLVFTKSDKGVSAEEMKECLMYLIQEHFPGQKAIFDFFNNAKVMKIDKAIKEDIGKVLTKSDIPELNIAYAEMDYQPMKPHVGVDQGAQVFLYKSITDLCKVASDNIKNAYKKAYETTMKSELEQLFKSSCTERDFIKLSDQFAAAKEMSTKIASNDPIILKELALLNDITNFVLEIIPENNNLRSMVETNIKAVQCYNTTVMDYDFTVNFLEFLQSNSANITAKDQFHKAWSDQIKALEKPKIGDLSQDLEKLYKKAIATNVEINKLHEQGNLEAEKELAKQYRQELEENQREYQKQMQDYQSKLIEASRPSGWAMIPFVGPVINGIIKLCQGSPSGPVLKELGIKVAQTLLDKSFAEHLEYKPLLGDIDSYWGGDSGEYKADY